MDSIPDLHVVLPTVAGCVSRALTEENRFHAISDAYCFGNTPVTLATGPVKTQKDIRLLKQYFHTIFLYRQFSGTFSTPLIVEYMEDVSSRMESIIDVSYLQGFRDYFFDAFSQAPSALIILYLVLEKQPPDFEEVSVIRRDAAQQLVALTPIMAELQHEIHQLILATKGDTDVNGPHSKTPFDCAIIPPKVHPMAERLHKLLHQEWPCSERDKAHDIHKGNLGNCTHAYMQLDPRWITKGVQGDEFAVFLSNEKVYQECKIYVGPTCSPTTLDFLCLRKFSEVQGWCLYLVNAAERLRDVEEKATSVRRATSACVLLTIRELLTCSELYVQHKLCLQLILARALLPLLKSIWVEASLTLDRVSILCTTGGGEWRPLFDQLFVSTCFRKDAERMHRPNSRYGHPAPAIQALGIMIASIQLGDKLERVYRGLNHEREVAHLVGNALLKNCRNHCLETQGVLKSIEFCLDPLSFSTYRPLLRDGTAQYDRDFAQLYYNKIVCPLEHDLIVGRRWTWEQASWKVPPQLDERFSAGAIVALDKTKHPVQDDINNGSTQKRYRPILAEASRIDEGVPQDTLTKPCRITADISDARICTANVADTLQSSDWFKKLHDCHTHLYNELRMPMKKSQLNRRIKVAVIDTGINTSHEAFKDQRAYGLLEDSTNLVTEDDGDYISDSDGHGTHMCHTLLQTAPYVRIYPIRVFRGSHEDSSSAKRVAKAIRNAISTYDVDIISISLGFFQDHDEIKEAIDSQYHRADGTRKRVLVFAAACNNRSLETQQIGYPARLHEGVICVFSSKLDGSRSTFSPKGRVAQHNISVVGENIKAACLGNAYSVMSGTSCATPIVAGVAAMLLELAAKDAEFFRQHQVPDETLKEWEKKKYRLREVPYMRIVLRKCMGDSQSPMDGRYDFLRPWNLLSRGFPSILHELNEALL